MGVKSFPLSSVRLEFWNSYFDFLNGLRWWEKLFFRAKIPQGVVPALYAPWRRTIVICLTECMQVTLRKVRSQGVDPFEYPEILRGNFGFQIYSEIIHELIHHHGLEFGFASHDIDPVKYKKLPNWLYGLFDDYLVHNPGKFKYYLKPFSFFYRPDYKDKWKDVTVSPKNETRPRGGFDGFSQN